MAELPEVSCATTPTIVLPIGGGTVTVTDRLVEPPAPEQVSVKVLAAVSEADCTVPLVGRDPLHAPDDAQEVAFVLDHCSVVVPPRGTESGFAERLTVGSDPPLVTFTVTERLALPPLPLQLSVYVLVLVSAPVLCVPLTLREPLHAPDALQLVALVTFQFRVLALPEATDVGLALNEIDGAPGGGGGDGLGSGVGDVLWTSRLVSLLQAPRPNAARKTNVAIRIAAPCRKLLERLLFTIIPVRYVAQIDSVVSEATAFCRMFAISLALGSSFLSMQLAGQCAAVLPHTRLPATPTAAAADLLRSGSAACIQLHQGLCSTAMTSRPSRHLIRHPRPTRRYQRS